MKTPVQELIDIMIAQRIILLELQRGLSRPSEATEIRIEAIGDAIKWAQSFLEMEKDTIVDFTYKYGDENLAKIAEIYNEVFNTNEK